MCNSNPFPAICSLINIPGIIPAPNPQRYQELETPFKFCDFLSPGFQEYLYQSVVTERLYCPGQCVFREGIPLNGCIVLANACFGKVLIPVEVASRLKLHPLLGVYRFQWKKNYIGTIPFSETIVGMISVRYV